MTSMPDLHLYGSLAFNTEIGELLNAPRIRLLEAIQHEGSLLRAARSIPLSYKAAWDAVETMNRLAGAPLVKRTVGGRNGGGTVLTEHGLRLVALYRAVDKECQSAIDALLCHIREGGSEVGFRYRLHRQSLGECARDHAIAQDRGRSC